MPNTPIPQSAAVNPYAGYLGVAPSYGLPPFPTMAPGVGQAMMPILNSSATSTAVPGFPFGTAPVFPGVPSSYYYPPSAYSHPVSYAAPMTAHALGIPASAQAFPHPLAPFSYPYIASGGYAPTTPFATFSGWPYVVPPPVATTSGPFAGATVQTHTASAPNESSVNSIISSKGDASSKESTSPVDAKNVALGSGSDTNSGFANHHRAHHSSDTGQGISFNIMCSNRAISENRQLIVKFLTDDTNEQQFRELFERFGPVENARVIYDKKTNHTKGFGFITYRFAEHAVQALRNMGGYQLHGRQLNVALAQTERKRAFSPTELVSPQTHSPQMHIPQTHSPQMHSPQTHSPQIHSPQTASVSTST